MIHPTVIATQIKTAKEQHQQRVALLCQVVDEFCPPPTAKKTRGRLSGHLPRQHDLEDGNDRSPVGHQRRN